VARAIAVGGKERLEQLARNAQLTSNSSDRNTFIHLVLYQQADLACFHRGQASVCFGVAQTKRNGGQLLANPRNETKSRQPD
jgi:hypothetical protein